MDFLLLNVMLQCILLCMFPETLAFMFFFCINNDYFSCLLPNESEIKSPSYERSVEFLIL